MDNIGMMNSDCESLVTAVIPVYNHEKYVVASIRSILEQTYPNIELIVINDGSTDKSHEAILTITDECCRRFTRFEYVNRENIGLSATLNEALSWSHGKYFSAMASDDVALSCKFSSLVQSIELAGDKYAAAFGDALFINEGGERIWLDSSGGRFAREENHTYGTFLEFHTGYRNFSYKDNPFVSYSKLIIANYLPAMSNIVRVEFIKKCGGWTIGNLVEDWEMWLKLSKEYGFLYVDKPVSLYRLHGKNATTVLVPELVLASYHLVKREKSYCCNNSLQAVWKESNNIQTIEVLRNPGISIGSKISIFTLPSAISFALFICSRLMRKLGKMIRRMGRKQ